MKEDTYLKRMFFHALKRGTGEAYLIARDNPAIDFSKFIIKGALNNYAYDRQCEDSRAQYIFDLISISRNKEKIRQAVLKGLATERSDTWNLTHLFDLTKIYALQGDAEARQAIYDNSLLNPIECADWIGFSEILELGGFDGLLFIAEKYGKWLEQNPEDWQDSTIISRFQEQYPEIKVLQKLKKAAKKNHYIKVYLDNIQNTDESRAKRKRITPVFIDVVDEVLNSKPFLSFRRKRKLTESELSEIATQLVTEKNKANQEKLLEVFDSYPFPLDNEFILKLATQKSSSKNRIQEYAIMALKHLNSENIRQFALKRIPKSTYPQQFIYIQITRAATKKY